MFRVLAHFEGARSQLKGTARKDDKETMLERLSGSGWGSIDIDLPVEPIRFSETIEGSLTLKAKRDIGPGLLTMALVCHERQSRVVPVKNGRSVRPSRQANQREVWRNETILDEQMTLEESAEISIPWSLDVPTEDMRSSAPSDLPDWAKGTLAVLNNLTMANQYLTYRLEGRFKHEAGFTLRRNLEVHVLS